MVHLALNDWRVSAGFVHEKDFLEKHGEWTNAECQRDVWHRTASIAILHPDEARTPSGGDHLDLDPEIRLVHELLHLSMSSMDHCVPELVENDDGFTMGREQHINAVARCLVLLDRKSA